MKIILSTHGESIIVDDEDWEWLSHWSWYVSTKGYVIRHYRKNGKMTKVYMHREINKTPDDLLTDHINGNKLDNRKCNLRSCKNIDNMHNRGKYKNNNSGYKGVYWDKRNRKWKAEIRIQGRQIYLGEYFDLIYAAGVYDQAAKQYFGEFARLNFNCLSGESL